jgi:hypothetical protein
LQISLQLARPETFEYSLVFGPMAKGDLFNCYWRHSTWNLWISDKHKWNYRIIMGGTEPQLKSYLNGRDFKECWKLLQQ